MLISDLGKVNELVEKRDSLLYRLKDLALAKADVKTTIFVTFKSPNVDGIPVGREVRVKTLEAQTANVVELARESLEAELVKVETEMVEAGVKLDI